MTRLKTLVTKVKARQANFLFVGKDGLENKDKDEMESDDKVVG